MRSSSAFSTALRTRPVMRSAHASTYNRRWGASSGGNAGQTIGANVLMGFIDQNKVGRVPLVIVSRSKQPGCYLWRGALFAPLIFRIPEALPKKIMALSGFTYVSFFSLFSTIFQKLYAYLASP
jgi:hypothetical protein